MASTLTDYVRTHAGLSPNKVFWRQLSGATVTEVTYEGFYNRAKTFSAGYAGAGLSAGQPVLIFLPHGAEAVAAFFGAMLIGAVPSFMPLPSAKQHPAIYWAGHLHLLQRVGPCLLLTDRQHAAQMTEHGLGHARATILAVEDIGQGEQPAPTHDVHPGSVALLQHSSGTTSLKKGVALSHRAILRQVELYADRLGMGEADTIVSWLPLYHDMGLIACTVMPLVLGQTVTSLDPFEWVSRPATLFDAIDRYDGRFAWMPNFAFEHLVRTVPESCVADLSRLRALIDCSEPCKPETFARFQHRFARLGVRTEQLQVCYAMAETVFAVSQTQPGQPATVIRVDAERLRGEGLALDAPEAGAGTDLLGNGHPLPGLEVRVRDGARDLLDNAVGEIVVRGDIVFDGYFNDPETTRARLDDGWYHTRDRGFMRGGELFVLGRQDDLIIVNGRNLYAHEVETLVAGVPGVKPGRAVAFGVFNAETGSEELVLVAERDTAPGQPSDAEISRAVRGAVNDQTNIEVKVCRLVAPGWLVKTTSGKIGREANRAKYLAEIAAPAHAADRAVAGGGDTLDRLAEFIAKRFGCARDAIRRETTADDVEGWDSLTHATLILGVERLFGVRFADTEIFGFACVGDLADRIDALLADGSADQEHSDRVVYRSDVASIVRLGNADGPDVIVFAGKAKNFAGQAMMDFSSIFARTSGAGATQYYVTDHAQAWFTKCFDDIAARLNALSDKPKIIFGFSMGGYAALRFATALSHVIGVLAFVPQTTAPSRHIRASGKPRRFWNTRLVPGVPYCIVYGEAEDITEKAYISRAISDPSRQSMLIVPNCGHNLAGYLNKEGLLVRVVECCLHPETMAERIADVVSVVKPIPGALAERAALLARKKARRRARAARTGSAGPRPDASAPPNARKAPLAERFAAANVTQDGRLTLEQAKARLPFAMRHFAAIDIGGKGYVTLPEIRAFRRAQVKA